MGSGTSAKSGSESHLSSAHGSVPNDPGLSHSRSDSLAKVAIDRAAKNASTTSWSSSVTSPSLPETSGSSTAETLKPTFWRGAYRPRGVGDRPRPLPLGQALERCELLPQIKHCDFFLSVVLSRENPRDDEELEYLRLDEFLCPELECEKL